MPPLPPSVGDEVVDPARVRRKVAWRILPLLLCCYVVAYLDRANAGYAKLRMKGSLGFDDEVFGWAFGLFFAGYLLLEIPGALLVERWSARKWFARILVTWGFCSMATALVRTPQEFYAARFLLGLAEAGFFPGVIIYLTHWFPRAERARALAALVLGVPVSLALGAKVSGYLLEVHWFGLEGWQWVFIVEGMPAVVLGVVVLLVLADRPAQARWLTPAERAWLETTLAEERRANATAATSVGAALRRPTVWLLALGICAANTGGYALVFWLPTVVNDVLIAQGSLASSTETLAWTCLVYLFGFAGVWLSGQSSDRTGERKWHCAAGMFMTGLCLALSLAPGHSWQWPFAWLCAAGFFAYAWPPPFWVLPTMTLSAAAAAVAVGFINICANLAGLLGNPIVGAMKARGAGDADCLLFLASCYAAGALVIASIRLPASPAGSYDKGCPVPEREPVTP